MNNNEAAPDASVNTDQAPESTEAGRRPSPRGASSASAEGRYRTPAFIGVSGAHHPFVCRVCNKPAECDGDCNGVQPHDDAHVHHGVCSDRFGAMPTDDARHSTRGLICSACDEPVPCAVTRQEMREGSGYVGPQVSDDRPRFPPPTTTDDASSQTSASDSEGTR